MLTTAATETGDGRLVNSNGHSRPEGQAPITPGTAAELPLTVIEPQSGWQIVDLKELWRYRELLYFLTWRDVKVRYKQTVLGSAWAVLQPLLTMMASGCSTAQAAPSTACL